MSDMLEKFLPRTKFDSYEDFKANYKVTIPENFNFGFDIVDGWAKEKPDNRALVWCDDDGEERTFTFADMSRLSHQLIEKQYHQYRAYYVYRCDYECIYHGRSVAVYFTRYIIAVYGKCKRYYT